MGLNSRKGDELLLLWFFYLGGFDLGFCRFKFLLLGFLVVGEKLGEDVRSYGRRARPLLEDLVGGEG